MSNVFIVSNRSVCTKAGALIVMVLVMYYSVEIMAKKPIPVASPFPIFTPSSEVVFKSKTAMVIYTVDATPCWNSISTLANAHNNLTDKAKTLDLSLAD